MSESKIEWTDATWNPVRGCTKISPGCKHCYAETFAERFRGVTGHPYEQGFDLRLVPEKLSEPLTWKKPRRVFVNSMSDLFHEGVPDSYIDQVFAVMALAPHHTFQVLTKRPVRMLEYLTRKNRHFAVADAMDMPEWLPAGRPFPRIFENWPIPSVWLGVSVESQEYKTRIDALRHTPAAIRFLSLEPLLEDLGKLDLTGINWVIVGGESGPGARPFNIQWALSIIRQCRAAGVPCFIKQLGAHPELAPAFRIRLQSRKGGDMTEWPSDLRVREMPAGAP
jgi:protein gp37